MTLAAALRETLSTQRTELLGLITRLSRVESPSDDPKAVDPAFALLSDALSEVGVQSLRVPGRETGGALLGVPVGRKRHRPVQLVVGHIDTVWPMGTTVARPIVHDEAELTGPGTYDMKAGLAQAVFALRALRQLELQPEVTPVLFVNSDEEIGSFETTRHVIRLARIADRAFVLEPSLGPTGKLKTARKGIGKFTVIAHGRAAHAGLDPEAGASAILELSHQIQALFALNDPTTGVTVNVGTIDGGMRPNVVAPISSCVVDVRVPDGESARAIEAAIHGLKAVTPGVHLEISGRVGRPAMVRTEASQLLWERARAAGAELGMDLEQATAGGGSDGNTTSQYTPTLDGLGPVGGGAHAIDEHVRLDSLVDRTALLAMLLLTPALEPR